MINILWRMILQNRRFLGRLLSFVKLVVLPLVHDRVIFLLTILGVACGTAFFHSMISTSHQARESINRTEVFPLSIERHDRVSSIFLQSKKGRISPSFLRECEQAANRGIACIGRVRSTWSLSNSRSVEMLAIHGSFSELFLPAFSSSLHKDVGTRMTYHGLELEAASVFGSPQRFVILPWLLAQGYDSNLNGFDHVEVLPLLNILLLSVPFRALRKHCNRDIQI